MARIASKSFEQLPHNADAEAAVLGAILIDPDAMLVARQVGLAVRDFFREANGYIYAAAVTMADRYETADLVTIGDLLSQRGHLDAVGGPAGLTALIEATPTSVHTAHYANIVKRMARQRRLIAVSGEIAVLAHQHDGTVAELFDAAARLFFETVDVSSTASHLYGTDDVLLNYLVTQQERGDRLGKDPDALITTGIQSLDRILGDLPGGYLHAVVARSSTGKTMYMEQIAEHNAKRGHRVAFYHLELSHQTMLDRRMARYSGISVSDLRRGYTGPEVSIATNDIRGWQERLVYIHCPGWSAERIAADIARLYARGECELAIVDYWQKITAEANKGANTTWMVGQQVEVLKTCAESLDIPLVLGSQVSRGYKDQKNRRPRIEDIRNSGELEEKCNQGVVLWRPVDIDDRPEGAKCETIEARVEKNSTGALGRVDLVHLLGRFALGDSAPAWQEEETAF